MKRKRKRVLCRGKTPSPAAEKKSRFSQQKSLDKRPLRRYNSYAFGVWRSLVSRLVRVQEAVGSNPATPTNKETSFVYQGKRGFFCYLYYAMV